MYLQILSVGMPFKHYYTITSYYAAIFMHSAIDFTKKKKKKLYCKTTVIVNVLRYINATKSKTK